MQYKNFLNSDCSSSSLSVPRLLKPKALDQDYQFTQFSQNSGPLPRPFSGEILPLRFYRLPHIELKIRKIQRAFRRYRLRRTAALLKRVKAKQEELQTHGLTSLATEAVTRRQGSGDAIPFFLEESDIALEEQQSELSNGFGIQLVRLGSLAVLKEEQERASGYFWRRRSTVMRNS